MGRNRKVHRYIGVLITQHCCAPMQYFNATGSLCRPQRDKHCLNAPSPPPPTPGSHLHSLPPNPCGRPEPPGRSGNRPHPGLPIAQLLPPRRRHFARPRLTKGPNAGQRHRPVQQVILAQNTNPLGGIIVMSTIIPYRMGASVTAPFMPLQPLLDLPATPSSTMSSKFPTSHGNRLISPSSRRRATARSASAARIFASSRMPPDRNRRAQLRQLDISYTIWYSNHMV